MTKDVFMHLPRSRLLIAAGVLLLASACMPVSRNHGFVVSKETPGDVESGVDTKTTVLSKYGNPSTTGVFEKNKWYYMSELREQLGYMRPHTKTRTVTAIAFNPDGVVDGVSIYTIEDGRIVNMIGRKTPTRGRELSILQQLLGGVGRLPPGTIGGNQNLPGGAGGPRRQ
jgi:outer membrane protein assembly factor BamE (lipoprotein component of BamABCDE complex)